MNEMEIARRALELADAALTKCEDAGIDVVALRGTLAEAEIDYMARTVTKSEQAGCYGLPFLLNRR